jgi:glutamate-1-semialdehyde 2,1-aminomutase
MLGLFFTDTDVKNFDDAKKSNLERFAAYYKGMLEKGIYLAPSQFEAFFISSAHTTEHLDQTITAAQDVFKELSK